MGTLEENKSVWNSTYSWPADGEEWSSAWGSAAMQWYGTLLPLIHTFVPANVILEIACGKGRWTQYLKNIGKKLLAVDLSENCIEACRRRFSEDRHVEFYVTDGISLSMVADASIDFVFSFDSLVHADAVVMRSYVKELSRVLSCEGVAFFHHSNLAAFQEEDIENTHWRAPDVSADLVASYCKELNLECISQEIFPWADTIVSIDAISVIVHRQAKLAKGELTILQSDLMREAALLKRFVDIYALT
jgi:ubiquinone/menaquinone biosynthesis C-methylase UbiE